MLGMASPQAFPMQPAAPQQQAPAAAATPNFAGLLAQPQASQQRPVQASPMMALQGQLQQGPAPQNTYTAVRQMVDQMSQQVQSADLDEEQHKNWCDNEISKNQAVLD